MIRLILVRMVVLSLVGVATAQVSFTEHLVQNGTLVRHVSAGDLDNDGFCEAVSSDWISSDVIIWTATTPDTWTPTTIDYNFSYAQMTQCIDMDEDGDLDIFAAASGANSGLRWWRNDGVGVYTVQQVDSQFPCIHFDLGDIDGDGDIDVVAVRNDYTELVWYENDMPNAWTQHMVENTLNTEHAHLGDLDGDGDLDIAAFHQPETLAWHEQDSENAWIYHEIDLTMLTTTLVIDDLDNDGDNDLISHENFASDMYVWEQVSPGTFEDHLIFGGSGYIDGYDTADIDGDGFKDIVLTLNAANRVSYLSYNSIDDYTEHVIVAAYTQPHGVQVTDMDGDADPDVLVWTSNALKISWFEHGGYTSVDESNETAQPVEFAVTTVYPNPFNATTTVRLELPFSTDVQLDVFNLAGQQVDVIHEGMLPVGTETFAWQANSLPSGTYFIRTTLDQRQTSVSRVQLVR